ncbi:MAG: hypothetical protein ACPG4T_20170 [Nannocystaceae bacterium]
MADVERLFHLDWLGRVQPIEGLVFSEPVLTEAKVMFRRPRAERLRFADLCSPSPSQPTTHVIGDHNRLWFDLLGFDQTDFDTGEDLLPGTSVYVAEGEQTLTPTLALRTGDGTTPQTRYGMLVWVIPEHLDLDANEVQTGPWNYPPIEKMARMLSATGVPIGLLCNGRVTRLVYLPGGGAIGWVNFVTDHMLARDGASILDAFWSLLDAGRWFRVPEARRLPVPGL